MLRQLGAGLLQLFDGFLTRFVQIAEIGQNTFAALAFFTAEDQLHGAVLPLPEGGIELFGEEVLLGRLLLLQFGYRGVQAGNVFAQLGERALGVAQLAAGLGDGFFLLTQLILQRAALLLLLLHRFFFLGDALLDVFQLGFIVFRRLAGERQQQDASAKYAGAHGGEHPWRGAFRQRSAACVCASGYP